MRASALPTSMSTRRGEPIVLVLTILVVASGFLGTAGLGNAIHGLGGSAPIATVGTPLATGGSSAGPGHSGSEVGTRSPAPPAALCATYRASELLPTRPVELATARACAAQASASVTSTTGGPRGWEAVTQAPPGFAVYDQAMTYDAADGYLLLFGSVSSTDPFNGTQTWTYANGTWTQLHLANSPESCPSSGLAYDATDGYVVYFGGGGFDGGNCTATDQTWTYHAGAWTQLHPTLSPSARDAYAFSNDSADGYLLLFGGILDSITNHVPTNETWSFSGGSWTLLHPTTAPSARSSSGMTYDAKDGYVLLFGGAGAVVLDDTWSYLAGTWTNLSPSSHPIAPWPDGLAYDASDGVAVYTSAENITGSEPEQVWTFTGGNWTQWVAGQGNDGAYPPNRLAEVTAYDWRDGYLAFYGGVNDYYTFPTLSDLWTFHDQNWTERSTPGPSPRMGAAAVYDGADGYFLLFGGQSGSTYSSDSWAWSKGIWHQLTTNASPPARAFAGMTYDGHDGYVLLFGGAGSTGLLNDTWEFTDGGWTKITPARAPPAAEVGGNLVYDAGDGYVVLVDTGTGGPTTWAYSGGVWQNLTGAGHSAPPYPTNGIIYDAADARVLLFGTETTIGSGGYAVNDTWTFLNANWTNVTSQVGTTPVATWSGSLTYDATENYVLFFGGYPSSGYGSNTTWTFVANHWTEQYTPVAPSGRYYATLGYDAASGTDLLFGGYEDGSGLPPACSTNVCGDTWQWAPGGAAVPKVEEFAASPNPVDTGTQTNLSVQVYGGTTPYTYAYLGLPAGCATANTSELGCDPSMAGNYTVTVQVTDSTGNGSSAETALAVVAPVALTSFNASPSTVAIGVRTLLSVDVANGTPPIGYAYTGLPTGCASQSVPTLPCTPTESGTFDISVVATDRSGLNSTGHLSLTVVPAGSGTAPTITSYGAAPDALTLGNSTTLYLNASSSTGTVEYAYSDLPPGCATANVTFLVCTPTSAGVFSIDFIALLSSGPSTSVEANLTVYPDGGGGAAFISAFGASPGTVIEGNATIVTVHTSGGTAPLTFSYPTLPPGCVSANTDVLPCTPNHVGNFTISVIVTDALGNRTGARGIVSVVPWMPPGNLIRPPPTGSSPLAGLPYLDWAVGVVAGLVLALVLTDQLLRRRRLREEGDQLVRSLNEEAEKNPPSPPAP